MKKIMSVLILFVAMIILTACSQEGKSIDDCKEHGGKCYYNNGSVKNDDSEISKGLFNLLLEDDHDMNYHYKINPIDDKLWIEYETNLEISHSSFNEMISVFDDVTTLVNNLYDIADIEFTVLYLDDIDMDVYYDNDNQVAVLFDFDEFITEESSGFSGGELADAALEHIGDYLERIKICLDYDKTNLVSIFNVSYNRITLEVENDVVTYRLPERLNTESFESKLLEQFGEYNLVKYIDE